MEELKFKRFTHRDDVCAWYNNTCNIKIISIAEDDYSVTVWYKDAPDIKSGIIINGHRYGLIDREVCDQDPCSLCDLANNCKDAPEFYCTVFQDSDKSYFKLLS